MENARPRQHARCGPPCWARASVCACAHENEKGTRAELALMPKTAQRTRVWRRLMTRTCGRLRSARSGGVLGASWSPWYVGRSDVLPLAYRFARLSQPLCGSRLCRRRRSGPSPVVWVGLVGAWSAQPVPGVYVLFHLPFYVPVICVHVGHLGRSGHVLRNLRRADCRSPEVRAPRHSQHPHVAGVGERTRLSSQRRRRRLPAQPMPVDAVLALESHDDHGRRRRRDRVSDRRLETRPVGHRAVHKPVSRATCERSRLSGVTNSSSKTSWCSACGRKLNTPPPSLSHTTSVARIP